MSKHEIGAGNIELDLVNHGKVVLKPTLEAAIKLTSNNGGINKLVERCLNYEFDAILSVITAGIGSNSKDLPELVFKTGMLDLAPHCIRFLHVIANGGRPLQENEEVEGDAPLESSSL